MKRFLLVLILLQPVVAAHSEDAIDFGRKIRPLLADKCFACHGLDAEHREGGLRLDVQEGVYGTGESGAVAVVPGSPDQSSVFLRLIAEGDEQMPPAKSGESLEID